MVVDIDDILDLFDNSDNSIYAKGTIEDAIYDGTLKSIQPERKKGKWTETLECSVCGFSSYDFGLPQIIECDYCPSCGAYMRGE